MDARMVPLAELSGGKPSKEEDMSSVIIILVSWLD